MTHSDPRWARQFAPQPCMQTRRTQQCGDETDNDKQRQTRHDTRDADTHRILFPRKNRQFGCCGPWTSENSSCATLSSVFCTSELWTLELWTLDIGGRDLGAMDFGAPYFGTQNLDLEALDLGALDLGALDL